MSRPYAHKDFGCPHLSTSISGWWIIIRFFWRREPVFYPNRLSRLDSAEHIVGSTEGTGRSWFLPTTFFDTQLAGFLFSDESNGSLRRLRASRILCFNIWMTCRTHRSGWCRRGGGHLGGGQWQRMDGILEGHISYSVSLLTKDCMDDIITLRTQKQVEGYPQCSACAFTSTLFLLLSERVIVLHLLFLSLL